MDHLETHWDLLASHRTAENTQTYMLDWIGWIYLRTSLLLEHLAVLTKLIDFGLGPSEKFLLSMINAFSNRMGVNLFLVKKRTTWGEGEVCSKDKLFADFAF